MPFEAAEPKSCEQPQQAGGTSPFAHKASLLRKVLWHVCVVTVAMGIGVLFAIRILATVFRPYDDEGYMLLSLAQYLRAGHLYTATYSQYGPFYFYAQSFWFWVLRLTVNHDSGRLVTLVDWALSSFLAGQFIHKLTNNQLLVFFCILSCFVNGFMLANEPGHPQQVLLLLFMLASVLSCWQNSARSNLYLFGLGAIAAALLFTKINAGIFFVVALAHSLLCMLLRGWVRTAGLMLTLLFAVVGPPLLMHSDLAGWAKGYCFVALVTGLATFVCGLSANENSRLPFQSILWAGAGLLFAAALIIAVTLASGVSLADLVHGVVLAPLKHPKVFYAPMAVSVTRSIFAVVTAACAAAVFFLHRRTAFADWISAAQCATGLVILFFLPRGFPLASIVPLLPLGLVGLSRFQKIGEIFPRLFVTNLAATQFLQAYPVAGGQVAISAAPVILWTFICIYDGFDGLSTVLRRFAPLLTSPRMKQAIFSAVATFAFLPVAAGIRHSRFWSHYSYPASGLRGSSILHIPPQQEARYRILADSVHRNCNMLFTTPGMGSFNFWSDTPPPNGWNLTGWINAFDFDHQKQILSILESDPDACVLYNSELVASWKSTTDQLAQSPLGHYVLFSMVPVLKKDDYEIRVSPDRGRPWLSVSDPDSLRSEK